MAASFFLKDAPLIETLISKQTYFVIFSLPLILIFGVKKNKLMLIPALLVILSFFYSKNPYGVLYDHITMLVGIVLLVALQSAKIDEKIISRFMIITCLTACAWVGLEYINIRPSEIILEMMGIGFQKGVVRGNKWIAVDMPNVIGTLGNPNHSAAMIAVLAPFLPLSLLFFVLPTLFILNSTMAIVSFLAGLIVYYSKTIKNDLPIKITGALMAVGALSVTLIGSGVDSGRVQAWKYLLPKIPATLTGNGLDFFRSLNYFQGKVRWDHFHSELFEAWSAFGALGVFVFAYLAYKILSGHDHPKMRACCAALLVNSLGNFTFHIAPLSLIFIVCYSFLDKSKE